MQYTSTRDNTRRAGAAEAIVTGLAPDGGLFVPTEIQQMDIAALQGKGYEEIAFEVLRGFLPQFDDAFLQAAIQKSYTAPFAGNAGKLVKLTDDLQVLELWHGPTAAFKDYALQLMPRLLVHAKQIVGDDGQTLVLVATSGDTGSAALNGFAGRNGITIACFYPEDGTSEVQRLQMVTQAGDNVQVYAVRGNFDDAQRGVKMAFSDEGLRTALQQKNVRLSSANSINWGRLVPQIVYYISSYLQLCGQGAVQFGEEVDYCVPTGNFGDIMAGYYAKALGLPVGKLVCASNQNNVLFDFLTTGRYTAKRSFHKTSSPSMDILVSSNLERLLYHESGSSEDVAGWMRQLAEQGEYTVGEDVLAAINETFEAGWADEAAVTAEIAAMYKQHGYVSDPHTAVALHIARTREKAAGRPCVVLSTASPFKFSAKVLDALGMDIPADEFAAVDLLAAKTGAEVPAAIASLKGKPACTAEVIDKEEVPAIPLRV